MQTEVPLGFCKLIGCPRAVLLEDLHQKDRKKNTLRVHIPPTNRNTQIQFPNIKWILTHQRYKLHLGVQRSTQNSPLAAAKLLTHYV